MSEFWGFPKPTMDQQGGQVEHAGEQQRQKELLRKYPFIPGKPLPPWPLSPPSLALVPPVPGLFIIYDLAGPIYVGRSPMDLRRSLQAHYDGHGDHTVAVARRVGAGASLFFRYSALPLVYQDGAVFRLTCEIGAVKVAELRRKTLPQDR